MKLSSAVLVPKLVDRPLGLAAEARAVGAAVEQHEDHGDAALASRRPAGHRLTAALSSYMMPVLAATARTDFNDEDDETGQWTTNQAGVKHSYKYGFGLVDALAAVTAATTWTTWGAELTLMTQTVSGEALVDFDGAEHWVESEAAEFGSSDFIIESVAIYVSICLTPSLPPLCLRNTRMFPKSQTFCARQTDDLHSVKLILCRH